MRALHRKLLRDLFRSSGLLLTIASIQVIGLMCFVGMKSTHTNLMLGRDRYYAQCRMADFWIDAKKIPLSEIRRLGAVPGVVEAHPRISFLATVDLADAPRPINGLVVSLPDRRERPLCDIVLRRGSYFSPGARNEVIVNNAFARKHGLSPGDSVHLLLNNRRQEMRVVGTASSSEFAYLIGPGGLVPDAEFFGVFYVSRSFAEGAFDMQGAANQVLGRLSPEAGRNVDSLLDVLERRLEPYGVAATTPLRRQASNEFLADDIRGMGSFANVVPAIFLAVAAVVLNVLLTRLARQQRTTLGTLKAIGYGDRALFFHFLQYGVVVGLLGGLGGSVGGYLISQAQTAMFHTIYEFPELRAEAHAGVHLAGLGISLATALLGAFNGARMALRLQPAEAMRPEPPKTVTRTWIERIGPLWRSLSAPWRLAIRGVLRSPLRAGTGLFAATMGAGLLVCGFLMIAMIFHFLDFEFGRVLKSDVDLALQQTMGRRTLDEIRALPGVDLAEPLLHVGVTFSHGHREREGGVQGLLPGATLTEPRNAAGLPVRVPPTGLVMSRRLAEQLELRPGDRVRLRPVQGERRPVEAPIAAITDGYLGLAVYADIHYLSGLIGEPYALTGAQLKVDPRRQRELYLALKELPAIEAVTARTEMIASLRNTVLTNMSIFISFLVSFAGAIYFGSTLNACVVSLHERQREIATFRAIGYTPWQVGAMFLRESLLINAAGTLLGMPVGYGLMRLTVWSFNNDTVRMPVVTPAWVWLLAAVLSLLFVLAAQLVVQWLVHRLNVLDALKVKE